MQELKSISVNNFEQHFKGNGSSNSKPTKYHGKMFEYLVSKTSFKDNFILTLIID